MPEKKGITKIISNSKLELPIKYKVLAFLISISILILDIYIIAKLNPALLSSLNGSVNIGFAIMGLLFYGGFKSDFEKYLKKETTIRRTLSMVVLSLVSSILVIFIIFFFL
jgi:hypothetical protein